jgi:hypothetical protein
MNQLRRNTMPRYSKHTSSFETTIDRGGEDVDVTVHYTSTPGYPGSFYGRNGDPGDPPESGDLDIINVYEGKKDILGDLDGAFVETLVEEAWSHANDYYDTVL